MAAPVAHTRRSTLQLVTPGQGNVLQLYLAEAAGGAGGSGGRSPLARVDENDDPNPEVLLGADGSGSGGSGDDLQDCVRKLQFDAEAQRPIAARTRLQQQQQPAAAPQPARGKAPSVAGTEERRAMLQDWKGTRVHEPLLCSNWRVCSPFTHLRPAAVGKVRGGPAKAAAHQRKGSSDSAKPAGKPT